MAPKGEFWIGSGNYWGENSPNKLFNEEFVPKLRELGIKDKDMHAVADMFEEIYNIGYENGGHSMECATNEGY